MLHKSRNNDLFKIAQIAEYLASSADGFPLVAQKGKEGQAQVLPRDVAEPQEEKTGVKGVLIARAQKWKTRSKRLSSFLSKSQPTGKGAAARS